MSTVTDGYIERARPGPNGLIRFLERPVPGKPGVVERVYLNGSELRDGPVVSGTQLLRPGERPRRFRSSSAGYRKTPSILVSNKAFEQLWSLPLLMGKEGSGGMFGRKSSGSITVREFTMACRNRSRASCQIDTALLDGQIERAEETGLLSFVGTWHSEPGGGPSEPSDADLSHWKTFCRAHGAPYYVGATLRRPHPDHIGFRGSGLWVRVFERTSGGVVGPLGAAELIEQSDKYIIL